MKIVEFENEEGYSLKAWCLEGDADVGVIFAPGLGRGPFEAKFLLLGCELESRGIPSFGVSYSGVPPSEGDYYYTTINSIAKDLIYGSEYFQELFNLKHVLAVGHSIGVSSIAHILEIDPAYFEKIVGLASAINTPALYEFHRVRNAMLRLDPYALVTWENYKLYLSNVHGILEEINKEVRNLRTSTGLRLGLNFDVESQTSNFTPILAAMSDRVLLVHGTEDLDIPISSIELERFPNRVVVKGGGHNLEQGREIVQWLPNVVKYLIN